MELGRARTALDAVGEFAEISEPEDARAATVVVGPGSIALAEVGAFIDALRKIDSSVRVIGMGDLNGAAELFDGVLPAQGSVAALRGLLAPQGPVEVPPIAAPEPPAAVASVAPSPPTTPPSTPVWPTPSAPPAASLPPAATAEPDSQETPGPLAAMLFGRDPIAAAVADISARLGVACNFVPGEAQSIADAAASVRVAHPNALTRTLGWLRAPSVDRAIVETEAAKLAGWVMLAAQHDQLRRAAFTDELTGAFNRRYFNRFLAAALDQARTSRHTVTLLVFDIDNFKTYNDKYSHAAGDEILIEAVRLLTSVIRPTDRVCRVGGDEFAVIFHDPEGPRKPGGATTPQSIAQIAARFQKQICAHRFPKLLDEAPDTLTISGGLATFPWDGTTPEALLARADELAIQSKRVGKNLITFGPGAARVCQIGEEGVEG